MAHRVAVNRQVGAIGAVMVVTLGIGGVIGTRSSETGARPACPVGATPIVGAAERCEFALREFNMELTPRPLVCAGPVARSRYRSREHMVLLKHEDREPAYLRGLGHELCHASMRARIDSTRVDPLVEGLCELVGRRCAGQSGVTEWAIGDGDGYWAALQFVSEFWNTVGPRQVGSIASTPRTEFGCVDVNVWLAGLGEDENAARRLLLDFPIYEEKYWIMSHDSVCLGTSNTEDGRPD